MGVTMKKIILALVIVIPLLVVGLGFFSMSTGNIEDIVICSTNDESHYIPSSVCEYYLLHYRLTKEDIRFLEARSGLAFLFEISDRSRRDRLLKYFVAKGVSTSKPSAVDGYPPLHAAIINNDPELVEFLLANGANPGQKDENRQQTAREFVDFLGRTNSAADRSAIKELLSGHNP